MERNIHEAQNKLYIGNQQNPDAQMIFETDRGTMKILSTEVAPKLREQGIGNELIDYAVNYARKHKLMIDPVCSFAGKVMEETPEYQVVLEK
ncbi:GNAT family N-acetyltransferase [Halobacillus litoralis]|uniref:GNAT family N-acetyltransferase n=1 Tax=Halobacillus litoralis TaxID=45668 RepID=UPI001CFDCF93|nr:GNAT family N-acetyltransferase [Halobacillus litoralis]